MHRIAAYIVAFHMKSISNASTGPWASVAPGVVPGGEPVRSDEAMHGVGRRRPMATWQQVLISYGATRVYQATASPWIRQTSERLLGRDPTPAYVPPTTPGFLARDLLATSLSFVAGTKLMSILRGGASAGANLLTTSSGVSGAAAGAGAGAFTASAMRRIMGQSAAMMIMGTALDAAMANKLGPSVENAVNGVFGIKSAATVKSQKDGTVPTSMVKTSPEQFVRNFAHSLLGAMTYSTVLGTAGARVAGMVAARVAGPGGALLAGVSAALVAGIAVDIEDRLVGVRAANLAQDAYRGVASLLGHKLEPKKNDDIIPVPGDRVAWAVGGVAIPFATAVASGQQSQFLGSITPVRVSGTR